jgi:nicotinamidase-related amidase
MASVDKFEDHCWKDVVPAADMKLYEPYARETFIRPCAAVLAIDLYNLVYRGGPVSPYDIADVYPSSQGHFAHNAIEPIRRLLAAARQARLPIFYCTQDERPNARPPGARATMRRPAPPQPDDYEIYSAFKPEPSDVIIYKQRASAFEGTPLRSHLKLLGIESLIVCGEATSGCVRASVVDGYSSGLHVALVEECTFDQTELTHKLNMFDLHHKYVDVMHLDEVVIHLSGLRDG